MTEGSDGVGTPNPSVHQGEGAPPTVTSQRRPGRSAAQRKRDQRQRENLMYETADWQLFTRLSTLPQKAGCQPEDLGAIALKELVDNALDTGAAVHLEFAGGEWVVTDGGPGLDPAIVPLLYTVNRPLRSSKLRRMPLRGMLGNGLRVVMGAVAATLGTIVVETRGHRLVLQTDESAGETIVVSREAVPVRPGVTVRIDSYLLDAHSGYLAKNTIALAGIGQAYEGVSSPWWYGARDLHRLFSDVTPAGTTVGQVCKSLGLRFDDGRPSSSLSLDDAEAVLKDLCRSSPLVPAEQLGFMGPGLHPGWATYDGEVSYARASNSFRTSSGACVPYVVEAWAGCTKSAQKGHGTVTIMLAINRSMTVAKVVGRSGPGELFIEGCGLYRQVEGPGTGNYRVMLSVISPYIQLTSDGKHPALLPFSQSIAQVLRKACGAAHRLMDRPTRSISVKEAAWKVMPKAYRVASGDGRFPANARQVMYAARPEILRMTGKTSIDDSYFTQVLLPDYVAEHDDAANWDVVFDARGSFIEPHTGYEVRLGTIDVRAYLGERAALGSAVQVASTARYPTAGPEARFSAILFIEKEGFAPLLQVARIAERFDIGIMTTKGMSTTAARLLLDRLANRVTKILVMHDFDVSGFSIFGTLGSDGRRYEFANTLPIVDIGLRLTDVEEMGLTSEPVEISGNWNARAATLQKHGSTAREASVLASQRVELNAMASDVFISFLERKLIEHGVQKVVPDRTILDTHARRMIEQQLAADVVQSRRPEFAKAAASAALPGDLDEQVRAILARTPALAWDDAVAIVVEGVR